MLYTRKQMLKTLQIIGLILIGTLFALLAIIISYKFSNEETNLIFPIIVGYTSYLSLLFFGDKAALFQKLSQFLWKTLFGSLTRTIVSSSIVIVLSSFLAFSVNVEYNKRKFNTIISLKKADKNIEKAGEEIQLYNLLTQENIVVKTDVNGIARANLTIPGFWQLSYNKYRFPEEKVSSIPHRFILDLAKISEQAEKLRDTTEINSRVNLYKLPSVYLTRFTESSINPVVQDTTSLNKFTIGGIEQISSFVKRNGYIINFNHFLKIPNCVAYKIGGTPKNVRRPGFKEDFELKSAKTNDYRGSGYDRGHLVSSSDMHYVGEEAVKQANLMSAVAPQGTYVNRQTWRKLEMATRNLIKNKNDTVYVIAGVLFLEQDENKNIEFAAIGNSKVGVPSHFYRIVSKVDNGKILSTAFLVPNRNDVSEEFKNYIVSIDFIEEKSGFNFFSNIDTDNQKELESKKENYLTE
jgi:endonuclease G